MKVTLCPFKEIFLGCTYEWIRNPELRKDFLMRDEPSWEGHCAYFKQILADSTQHVLAIMAENVHVGNCGLKNIKTSEGTGELWLYVGNPSMRRKTIGKKAAMLMLNYGFNHLFLHTIIVHVADFNISARRLYGGLGFKEVLNSNDQEEWKNRGFQVIRMELEKGVA